MIKSVLKPTPRNVYYFVDTETTGLDRKKNTILEICVIKHIHRIEVDRLHIFIHPTKEDISLAAPVALKMNCYDPELWKKRNALQPSEAAEIINNFIQGNKQSAFIAHNCNFDWMMINSFLRRNGLKPNLPYKKIDTCSIAFAALQPLGLENDKLDTIRDFLGWSKEKAHTALQDCEDLINLFYLIATDPNDQKQVTLLENKLKEIGHVVR